MESTIYDVNYSWHGWESEPEITADGSGNPNTHFITVYHWGEEIATICHRASDRFPLDGQLAAEKEEMADKIVSALKAFDAMNG